jgi:hypothetical protein
MRTMNITRPLLSGLAIAAATWLVACSFQKTADPWTKDQLKDPAVLAQEIKENKAPVIFDIGPAGSIKGSVEIGATEDKEAMALLGTKLDGLAKNTEVVIYCGCCLHDRTHHFGSACATSSSPACCCWPFMGWGAYSVTQLPIDALPDVTNNQVLVNTSAPNLATQEVEQFITFPLEQAFKNLPDVVELRSVSRSGLSVITVVFKDDVPLNAGAATGGRTDQVRPGRHPSGYGRPELHHPPPGLGEIYQYTLAVDSAHKDRVRPDGTAHHPGLDRARQLLGVPGVADVSSFGGQLKQYEVAWTPRLPVHGPHA